MGNLSFKGDGQKKGQGDPYKSPRTRGCLESMSTVYTGELEEVVSFQGRQQNRHFLSLEGGWHSLQEAKWSCKNNLA